MSMAGVYSFVPSRGLKKGGNGLNLTEKELGGSIPQSDHRGGVALQG